MDYIRITQHLIKEEISSQKQTVTRDGRTKPTLFLIPRWLEREEGLCCMSRTFFSCERLARSRNQDVRNGFEALKPF